jgi:hypothetical protein
MDSGIWKAYDFVPITGIKRAFSASKSKFLEKHDHLPSLKKIVDSTALNGPGMPFFLRNFGEVRPRMLP